MKLLTLLAACFVLAGCGAKHAVLNYAVPVECHVSLALTDCDRASPPHCKRITATFDKHCEQLIVPKGK